MLTALIMLAEAAGAPTPMPMPAFLSGCWEEKTAEGRWTEECWTDTRGGVMIGSGRTGKGDSVGHWEWMRVERSEDGALAFYASPKGASPVGFKAVAVDGTSATFLNTDHEYPQRVRYAVTEAGLEAEISLADGSRPNRWSYRRKGGAN